MSGQPFIGSDGDNKEILLDNQIPNQGQNQAFMSPLDINIPLQNNITPNNSTNFENKPINPVSQQDGLPLNNDSPQTQMNKSPHILLPNIKIIKIFLRFLLNIYNRLIQIHFIFPITVINVLRFFLYILFLVD